MINHGLSENQINVIKKIMLPYSKYIECVGLFGSRATGNFRSNSDIDLVIYGSLDEKTIDRIYSIFKNSSLSLKVDIHAYNLIDYPPLTKHIDDHMVVLFNFDVLY